MRTTLASCSLTSFAHALKVSLKRNSRWRSWQLHLQADNAMYVSFNLIYWLIISPRRSEISVPMPDRLVCFSPFLCFCAYLFLISRFEITIYLRSWASRISQPVCFLLSLPYWYLMHLTPAQQVIINAKAREKRAARAKGKNGQVMLKANLTIWPLQTSISLLLHRRDIQYLRFNPRQLHLNQV